MLFAFDPYNILAAAVFTILLQAALFSLAAIFKTDVFTDITYSVNFVALAAALLFVGDFHPRQVLIGGVVIIWGTRLGVYLLTRILRIKTDDRFDERRGDFVRFFMFWALQAAVVWVVMMPATVAMSIVTQTDLFRQD